VPIESTWAKGKDKLIDYEGFVICTIETIRLDERASMIPKC
jgi:hypothetical protein